MGFCSNCGHILPDNVRFCDNCGAPVNPPQMSAYPNYNSNQPLFDKQPREKPWRIWILRILSLLLAAGLITMAIGFGGIIFISRSTDKTFQEHKDTEEEITDYQRSLLTKMYSAIFRYDIMEQLFILSSLTYSEDQKAAESKIQEYRDKAQLQFSLHPEDKEKLKQFESKYKAVMRASGKEFGYRYTMLEIGGYGKTLILIGGITAGMSLLLWLIFGHSTSVRRTLLIPSLIFAILLSGFIILVSSKAEEVDFMNLTENANSLVEEMNIDMSFD